MEIRRANLEDAKELNWLLTLLIRDEKQYDANINEEFVVANMYENYIDDTTRCILVAEEKHKILGYLYGYKRENDITIHLQEAKLDALYVKEEYRKQHIADALILEFKKWVKEQNISFVDVGVCSLNTKAKKLYSKHKFLTIKEELRCEINKD